MSKNSLQSEAFELLSNEAKGNNPTNLLLDSSVVLLITYIMQDVHFISMSFRFIFRYECT